MVRKARLTYTSNPSLKEYIGQIGEISRNEHGGYNFKMFENGQTIRTSAAKSNTTLGDVNYPACRNLCFETNSGSSYQFDFMDIERVVDGVRKVDNRFLGFEENYKVGDPVITSDGHKGVITDYNKQSGIFLVASEFNNGGMVAAYRINDLRHVDLNDKLNDVQQRASELNESHKANIKDSVDMGFGY